MHPALSLHYVYGQTQQWVYILLDGRRLRPGVVTNTCVALAIKRTKPHPSET
jgi:hypothetical protein